jgi:GMP synthase (glutamine-hydrolysing)
MSSSRESIVILDFGSQYTQLIARRVREAKVYSEILPFNTSLEEISARAPKGLILSGGPQSVFAPDSPHPDPGLYSFPVPILGICYGMQLLAYHLGGGVRPAREREYGRADLEHDCDSPLFKNLPGQLQVWMSHGDHIEAPPAGFQVVARTRNAIGAMEDRRRRIYALQFHPEVVHTPRGKEILDNFLFRVCDCRGDWTPASFADESVCRLRRQIGQTRAICALSGGVDSTVAAVLVHRAIGENLVCVFVDNGLLRKGEFEEVMSTLRGQLHLNVVGVDASSRFLDRLRGVIDPETKRKIIGEEFIRVFEDQARRQGDVRFLVQGTLYPDVIESVSVKGPSAVIKSHHNVGGLPEKMHLSLVEPLRELFKDEVRQVGRELGLPNHFVQRQPFPGPGLAVRILGEVTDQGLALLREAEMIVDQEIRRADLYSRLWQAFAVLLPVKTVGVMGDDRTYDYVVAVRAVTSVDGMTADWAPLPYEVLASISNRIVNEVRGINRVVYDVSSKPPSTIEWE